jgi:hypothetical protein
MSVNDPLCQATPGTQSITSTCDSMLLKYGIYSVSLAAWVERFPTSRFVVTTLSQYVFVCVCVCVRVCVLVVTTLSQYVPQRSTTAICKQEPTLLHSCSSFIQVPPLANSDVIANICLCSGHSLLIPVHVRL